MSGYFLNLVEFSYLPALIGLVVGFFIGKTSKVKIKSSILGDKGSDVKLQNEVLGDQVRQLEAKVKTLEKALELTSKN